MSTGEKKIVIISTYKILPIKNAGHKGIVYFADYLAKYLEVLLVGTVDNELNKTYNFRLIKMFSSNKWKRYGNFFYFFLILKIIKKNKSNIIIFEQPYMPIILFFVKLFTKVKCIYYSRNIEYKRFKSYNKKIWVLLYCIEYIYYKICDHIFTVSENDKNWATKTFKIKSNKITHMPPGVQFSSVPLNKVECKKYLLKKYSIPDNFSLLLFNGDLGYTPNTKALDNILKYIIPSLNQKGVDYKIIICGQNLPIKYNNFNNIDKIIFASFVEDISLYNIGSDIFINPVIEGGGVKVKLLEALAYNLYCVSTKSGAEGISQKVCEEKLFIADDNQWECFTNKIAEIIKRPVEKNIGNAFFNLYSMEKIGQNAASILKSI